MAMITPGEASIRLTQQATQDFVEAQQQRSTPVLEQSMSVSAQFREQFQSIQSHQSMNPYVAQAMARATPGATGYDAGMLPSPIMMTPPSTGVFRPHAPPPMMPIHPTKPPPVGMPPFAPQLPAPMFQSVHEQQARLSDARATERYAYASQAPNVGAQALGYMGGAYAGAKMGSRFGAGGALVGAIGGATLAGVSGLSAGLGNMADVAMRPSRQRHQMGGAIQRYSRDWVVGGDDVHALGRGLSRDASIELAGGVQKMSASKDFQGQTGEMFNQGDLMKIMKGAGQTGLMDMQQSVPQIEQQLKQVATTVSKFMQLTNDPDITNVIRKMGQLNQFGMNPQEMEQAAYNMKRFSRAAGTSIEGIQQMGGLPGAQTFQQAGMTAGAGFRYGNYAAAASRQAVASGDMSPRQLSLLGGVQGMTQRNIQAQAAFSSMPLFTAASAQYGPKGWDVDGDKARSIGEGGALGMVRGAVANMNQAVQKGGIGALVTYGTQQRELREKAMAEMTPAEMMAQRFTMAMQTGKQLGLKGEAAFSGGAQLAFGREVAEQMTMQAKSPNFWDAQKDLVQKQRRELATAQRAQVMEAGSGATMRWLKEGYKGSALKGAVGGVKTGLSAIADPFQRMSKGIGEMYDDAEDWMADFGTPEGINRIRRSELTTSVHAGIEERRKSDARNQITTTRRIGATREELGARRKTNYDDVNNLELQRAQAYEDDFVSTDTMATVGRASSDLLGAALGIGGIAKMAGATTAKTMSAGMRVGTKTAIAGDVLGGVLGAAEDVIPWMQGSALDTFTSPEMKEYQLKRAARMRGSYADISRMAAKEGGKTKFVDKATSVLGAAVNKAGGDLTGGEVLETGARYAKAAIRDAAASDKVVTPGAWNRVIRQSLMGSGMSEKEADKAIKNMSAADKKGVISQFKHLAVQDKDIARADQEIMDREAETTSQKMQDSLDKQTDRLDSYAETTASAMGIEITKELGNLVGKFGAERFTDIAILGEGLMSEDENTVKLYNERKAKFKEDMRKEGWSPEKQDEMWEAKRAADQKAFNEMSESEKDTMRGVSSEKWSGKKGTIGSITTMAKTMERSTMQSGFRSQGFADTLAPYIGKGAADELLQGDHEITAEDIAASYDEEALEKLRKSGPAGVKKADMMVKALSGTGKEKAAALASIEQDALAHTPQGEVQESVSRQATGEQADKLDREEGALDKIKGMFSDFKPPGGGGGGGISKGAANDFKEGARMFRQAMESDLMKKMR